MLFKTVFDRLPDVTKTKLYRQLPVSDVAAGGSGFTVAQLLRVARMAGVEVGIIEEADTSALESKINDLDELNLALTESYKEKSAKVRALQAKVRRLEKKLAK